MDGPNINWKFFRQLQDEQKQQYDRKLLEVGSCGLHTLNNGFKAGFKMWDMEKTLRALHQIFYKTPARREDFTKVTKTDTFPRLFAATGG